MRATAPPDRAGARARASQAPISEKAAPFAERVAKAVDSYASGQLVPISTS